MGKLNAKKRKELPSKDFAGPDRSYPIPDRAHAKAALARVEEFGSPAEKKRVREAVAKKFPDMEVKGVKKTKKGKKSK